MPAPKQGGGGAPQDDGGLGPLWITVGIFALCGFIWYMAHEQIVWFVLQIKFYEALFVSIFTTKLLSLVQLIPTVTPANLPLGDFVSIASIVGTYFTIPVAIVLVVLAMIIYVGNPIARYKKIYTMKRLFDTEKEDYPQIAPVANIDLVKEHVDKGPWAMAMTPLQFAKAYKLLQEVRLPGTTTDGKPNIIVELRRPEAYQVFALQLGRFWPGYDKLNIHTKALFAVFAARANRDSEAAVALLKRIGASSSTGKLNFAGAEELFNKHKNSKIAQRAVERHAYTLTLLPSLLLAAREDGVLASADFLWLKLVDRKMWFTLNSVGRQTPPTEAAGVYAHWLAERQLARKISTPMVEEAVNALEGALKEVIYIPEEETA